MAKSELHSALLSGTDIQREIDLESEYRNEGIALYQKMRAYSERKGDAALLKPGEAMLAHWYGPLESCIRIAQEQMLESKSGVSAQLIMAPLSSIEPEMLAVLALRELLGMMYLDAAAKRGRKLTSACYQIGRAAFAEINFDAIKKEAPGVHWILQNRLKRLDPGKIQWWANKNLDDPANETRVAIALGAWVINLVLESCYCGPIRESDAAFRIENRRHGKRQCKYLVMDQQVFHKIDYGHDLRKALRPRFGPMLVRPYPWTDEYEGGYAKLRTPLISKITKSQRMAMREEGGVELVYQALNQLSSTPWSINSRVLDVAQKLWDRGGDCLSMPPRNPITMPSLPSGYDPDAETADERWAKVGDEGRKAWKLAAQAAYRQETHTIGLRKETAGILDLAARHESDLHIFFPHQLDFRGRLYPVPVFLNHQGNDLCRGLLQFGRGVPCSDTGRWWLMVHAANCYGVDKVPYESRVDWVRQHAGDISNSVSDPERCEFWKAADKPWQFLAACYALDDDQAAELLPVQLDGSNNGLQWLSALTLDEVGGSRVNLIPMPTPADSYTDVCEVASGLILQEQRAGREVPEGVLEHCIRSVAKQNVMTTPYGVKPFGARGQIKRKLLESGVEEAQAREYSGYLVKKFRAGMEGMFPGAMSCMAWLQDCARSIVKHGDFPRWTSPIGMPVVQDGRKYRIGSRERIQTTLGEIRIRKHDAPVNRSKSVNGFAPNVIHSYDASHLMATALVCGDKGMDFAGVHDSYWQHADHCTYAQEVIREQFVLMIEQDLLSELESELRLRFPNAAIPNRPAYGSLDIENVKQSQYFFH